MDQEQHHGSKAACSISHISIEPITLHFQLLCSSLQTLQCQCLGSLRSRAHAGYS